MRYNNIGVDVDWVVLLPGVPVRAELTLRYGIEFTEEDESSWDWIITTPKLAHIPIEEKIRVNKEIWTNPRVLRTAPPRPGAVWALRGLRQLGADYTFVTSREPELWDITLESFQQWLPWITPGQIHIRQTLLGGLRLDGRMFKVVEAQRFNFDAFIEDDPGVAVLLARTTCVYLMKHRGNEAFWSSPLPPSIIPVEGWVQVYRHMLA